MKHKNCDNEHCEDGIAGEIYGEIIYCSYCELHNEEDTKTNQEQN